MAEAGAVSLVAGYIDECPEETTTCPVRLGIVGDRRSNELVVDIV
jgi:hypothetical protein